MSLLLSQLESSECTQQHDQIYAILSLIENGDHFPVDYNCSLIELLIETLAFMVRTEDPNHDNIQVSQKLADKLLRDLGLDNDDKIHVAPRSGLRKTRVPRGTESPFYQPWPSRPRHHILSSEFGEGHGMFTWSTSRSTTLFTPGQSDIDEELKNMFGDNLAYMRHFLNSKTSIKDLVTWNNALGILLILSPRPPAASAAEDDQPLSSSQETSTWVVRGRISFDRSLRRKSLFGAVSKDKVYYELYTSANGLPGAQVTIPKTGMDQDHKIWKTTLTLMITDVRSKIILFGLPEHQGIRLAAINLMTTYGGHPDFLQVEFWTDSLANGSGFKLRDRDIEVGTPLVDDSEADTTSYIRYRPHRALCSQRHAQAKSTKKYDTGDVHDCYYYLDFLSEENRIAACNVSVIE